MIHEFTYLWEEDTVRCWHCGMDYVSEGRFPYCEDYETWRVKERNHVDTSAGGEGGTGS